MAAAATRVPVDHPVFEAVRRRLEPLGLAGDHVYVTGGYVRDALAGVDPWSGDVDLVPAHAGDWPAVTQACRALCVEGVGVDVVPRRAFADFDVNGIRVGLSSGQVHPADAGAVQHVRQRVACCIHTTGVRPHRFAKMVRLGYTITGSSVVPPPPHPFPVPEFLPLEPCRLDRLPHTRHIMRSRGFAVVGADAFLLVGAGDVVRDANPCVQLGCVPLGPHADVPTHVQHYLDMDEDGRVVTVMLMPLECPGSFFAPVTIGYVPVHHDGQVDMWHPCARDLLERRLVFCVKAGPPRHGDMHTGMREVGEYLAIGFDVAPDVRLHTPDLDPVGRYFSAS